MPGQVFMLRGAEGEWLCIGNVQHDKNVEGFRNVTCMSLRTGRLIPWVVSYITTVDVVMHVQRS